MMQYQPVYPTLIFSDIQEMSPTYRTRQQFETQLQEHQEYKLSITHDCDHTEQRNGSVS